MDVTLTDKDLCKGLRQGGADRRGRCNSCIGKEDIEIAEVTYYLLDGDWDCVVVGEVRLDDQGTVP